VIPNVSVTPEYEALSVAGVTLVTGLAVVVKVAEVLAAGTVIEDGIVTTAGEADKPMIAPLLGAAGIIATVQVVPAGGVKEFVAHEKPFKEGCRVTVPPVLLIDNGSPDASAATAVTSCTWEDPSAGATAGVRLTVATTPFESGETLAPQSKQVATPGALLHDRDLFG